MVNNLNISKESKNNIDELINIINQDKSCIFVGAGISRWAGYPLISGVLECFREKTTGNKVTKDCRFWEEIEYYRKQIGEERYFETILQLFGPEKKERFLPNHVDIISIPFQSYLTTNFDYCLGNAAKVNSKEKEVQVYPDLKISRIDKGDIIHIHGVILPEDPDKYLGTIILSERDYENAYRGDPPVLPRFLIELFKYFTIVFVGYSMDDDDLKKIIFETRREITLLNSNERFSKIGTRSIPKHYIVFSEENRDNLGEIEELGVKPIYYRGEDERHYELQFIFDYIRNNTASIPTSSVTVLDDMFEEE